MPRQADYAKHYRYARMEKADKASEKGSKMEAEFRTWTETLANGKTRVRTQVRVDVERWRTVFRIDIPTETADEFMGEVTHHTGPMKVMNLCGSGAE